jgi:ComF family protein
MTPTDGGDLRCHRCRLHPSRLHSSRAIGVYDGSLRAIVHALKYDGRRSLARPLANMMRRSGEDVLVSADVVVPVPLHRSRMRERGFNQARDMAHHLGVPLVQALERTRATATQADLPASKRHANVRGAFRLARRVSVEGAIVVLVDDVSTTGATLEACATALLDAGAKEVRAITAARAVSRSRG